MNCRFVMSMVLTGSVLIAPNAFAAKAKKKDKKSTTTTTTTTTVKTTVSPKVEKKEAVEAAPAAAEPAPSASTGQENIVEKKNEGFFLAIGIGQAMSGTMKTSRKFTNSFTGKTASDKTTTSFSGAPAFTLEVAHFNPGKMGFLLGAYLEQPRDITKVEIVNSLGEFSAEPKGQTFSQYGGHVNLLMSGDIPYGFIGANFGSGELKTKDSDKDPVKLKGELGGQAGLGLRFGSYIGIEATYRLTQFSYDEETTLGPVHSSMTQQSAVVTLKLMIN